ncbi:hypothetical protein KJ656_12420 [bacterium]|nr:hypothetical protein [bacterium]
MTHRTKYTIEDMQKIAKERGGKCLSKKYINTHTKLKWQCEKNHVWENTPSNIKKGQWCRECAGLKKLSIEEMQEIARERGGKCLSKKYINANKNLKWQCSEGHIWENKPANIKRGQWCRECAGLKILDIKEMREIAKERGGKCLSEKYLGNKTKLKWQCKLGHIWEAVPSSVKRGSWCPECAANVKLNIQEMKKIAKERGGKCLSKKYVNVETKLKWQCSEGHIWEATPSKIKIGRWCPECSVGLGERICRIFFEQLFKKKFPKYRPKWLVNKENNQMELDGYCKALNLAFEHQGQQHFRHLDFFHSKQEFHKRIRDDKEKQKLCKVHGITLIQIPAMPTMLEITEVKDFVIKECKRTGFANLHYDIDNIKMNLQEAYIPNLKVHFETIKKISIKRGGKCLSKNYLGNDIKLTFQCKEGHIWNASPANIKMGTWCPACGGSKKLSIKEMQKIAKERGGECLSKEYINNVTKLKWRCSKGHIWENTSANIKRGQWCPECIGNIKSNIEKMQKIAKERGGECLSKEYINNATKLKWRCSENHIWETTPIIVKRGSWCPQCGRKKLAEAQKLSIEDMQIIAKERGGKCLSKEYVNSHTKLKWQCSKKHVWEAKPVDIKQGSWCPECAGNIKLSIEKMQKLAKERGGKCLSEKYINARTKLKWQCSEGHIWEAIPYSIKAGTWCPECAKNSKRNKYNVT